MRVLNRLSVLLSLILCVGACSFGFDRDLGRGTLRGRAVLTNADGQRLPAAGAEVSIQGSPLKVKCDANGAFLFRDLPPAKDLRLRVAYDPESDGVINAGLVLPHLDLSDRNGRAIDLGTVVLGRLGAIQGQVVGDDGVGLPSVQVVLGAETAGNTGADGHFAFNDLLPGAGYRVTAFAQSAEGTRSVNAELEVPAGGTAQVTLKVLSSLAIVLRGTVTGIARLVGQESGGTVSIEVEGPEQGSFETSNDGTFTSEPFAPGVYTLIASAPGYLSTQLTYVVVDGAQVQVPDLILVPANATCGVGSADTDGDGVGDLCDNCPALSNITQQDANHNGIGDVCEPLHVASVSPANTAIDVAPQAEIAITFTRAIDAASLEGSFSLSPSATGSFTWEAATSTARFKPTAELAADTTYTATLSTSVKDAAGTALAMPFTWQFTTRKSTQPIATKLVVIAGSTTAVAGEMFAVGLVTAAQDDAGHDIESWVGNVSVRSNDSAQLLGESTAVNGHASFWALVLTEAKVYELVFEAEGLTPARLTVTITPADIDARASSFAADTIPATAGLTHVPLTVTLVDGYGNAVPGTMVSLSSDDATDVFSTSQGVTGNDGVFQTDVVGIHAGPHTLTATFGLRSMDVTLDVVPGSATALKFLAQPQDVIAGATPPDVTVGVVDGFGNLVTIGTYEITLIPLGVTASTVDGIATFSGLHFSTAGTNLTLTANATGFGPASSATFTVSPASLSGKTSSLIGETSAVADGLSQLLVVATAHDDFGNPLANVPVTFDGGQSDFIETPSTSTGPDGTAQTYVTSLLAGTRTITAKIGAFTVTGNITFVPGVATRLRLLSQPTDVLMNATLPDLQVEVVDASNNRITQGAYTVSVASSIQAVGVYGVNGTSFSTAAGVATLSQLRVGTTTTGLSLIVSSTGLTSVMSDPFNVSLGSPSAAQSTLDLSGNTATADNLDTIALQLVVRDAAGNALGGVPVALSASGGGNALTADSGSTDPFGLFHSNLSSTEAGTKTITATFDGQTVTQSVTFIAGAASQLRFVTLPAGATAGDIVTPAPQVEITDRYGNRVTTSTATITLALDFGPTSFTSGPAEMSTLSTSSTKPSLDSIRPELSGNVVQAVSGLATFSSLQMFRSGNWWLMASASGLLDESTYGLPNGRFPIAPAAPSGPDSDISINPDNVVADGSATAYVDVRFTDAYGNGIPNQNATLTVSGGSAVLGAAFDLSDEFGDQIWPLTSTKAGTKTVSAVIGGITVQSTVTFVAGPATGLSFSTQPSKTAAGVAMSPSPAVTVTDTNGNAVSGAQVTLKLLPGNAQLGTATTDASGVATFALPTSTFTTAGAYSLQASLGALSATSSSFNVTGGLPAYGNTSLGFSPTTAIANGTAVITITATLRDQWGNLSDGYPATIEASGTGNGWMGPTTGTTNSAGQFSVGLTSTKAESKGVTITSGSMSYNSTAIFNAGPAAKLGFAQAPINTPAATPQTVKVEIQDVTGNHVGGTNTISISATPTVTISGGTTVQASSGTATFSTQINVANSYTLTASASGLTSVTSSPFNIVPAPLYIGLSTVTAADTVADGTSAMTVTLTAKDSYSNLITGRNVSFTVTSGSNYTWTTPSSGVTNASGQFSATLTSTKAEAKTITISDGLANGTRSVTFKAGPAAALVWVQQPTNTRQDVAFNPTPVLNIVDANQNIVIGGNGTIGLTLGNNTNGSGLSGSTGFSAYLGTASLTGTTVYKYGTGYTIVATLSSPPLTATSNTFDVGAPPWFILQGLAGYVRTVAIDPNNSSTIWVGGENDFVKSVGGGGFTSAGTISGVTFPFRHIVFDRSNSNIVYAAAGNGLYKTTSGGTGWTKVSTGLPSGYTINWVALDPSASPATTLYCVVKDTVGGIYKSTDGGTTWSSSGSGLTGTPRRVFIAPGTPSTLFANTSDQGIFKSTNGGATWSTFNTGIGATHLATYAFALDVTTPLNMYAGAYGASSNSVYGATGGASSWSLFSSLAIQSAYDIDVHPVSGAVFATDGSKVMISTNNGASWADGTGPMTGGSIETFAFPQDNGLVGYAAKGTLLYKTITGGL